VLVETMNRTREAAAATEAARAAGARVWVSFVVGPGGRLLSGEPLTVAAATVTELGAEVGLVNCARPNQVEAALPALADRTAGVYPNVEDRAVVARAGYRPPAVTTAGFAHRAARWVAQYGLAVVGGCCGTTPAHIAALHALRPVPEEAPWRPVTSSRN
jgi:S-methylmethionine-dependent homocysteine/selenocysteine methylase